MALVEGFDDKVIQFFGVLFIVVLIVLLWMSTLVVEMQIYRDTVFILERHTRRQYHDTRVTPITPIQTTNESPTNEIVSVNDNGHTNSTLNNDNPQDKSESSTAVENYESKNKSTTQSNDSSQSTCTDDTENEPQAHEDSIRIRLKYLDDNCRLVNGRLQENIGVFKRRYFSTELSSNKIIRLIFQGKVLHDEASLGSCGLHDNCVVHCLINQPHSTANGQQNPDLVNQSINEQLLPNMAGQGQRQDGPDQRDLNLATLLLALITIIILLLWYARIQFYTMFSFTSTVTLGILTGIFMFIAFLAYFVGNEEQQHH